jgi:hypothetical protein
VALIGIGGERSDLYLPTMKMLAANVSRLPLASVVSHRMPLERAGEAIDLAQSNESMKVVFAPRMVLPGA